MNDVDTKRPTFRLVPVELADAVRRQLGRWPAADPTPDDGLFEEWGVFAPFETVSATGRCHCRVCGELVPKGDDIVRFQIDFYRREFGRWGHLTNAYIHADGAECQNREENE